MPEFILDGKESATFESLDQFTQGYVEAAFWLDASPDSEEDMRDMGFYDLAPEALAAIIADCAKFQLDNAEALELAYHQDYSEARAGHDFWLTRNHHGAGYWDRDELRVEKLGDRLTKAAHEYSETSLYAGDDGKVYT